MKIEHYQFRVRLVFVCIVFVALVLGYRLYNVQIVLGSDFKYQGERQYVRPNHNLYERGDIFFMTRDSARVPAATLKRGYVVALNPTLVENPEEIFEVLIRFFPDLDKEDFMYRATKENDPYEEIASRVSQEVAEQINEKDLAGVRVDRQQWRYYPGGSIAARTVGFVAYQGDELAGRYGLERSYERVLSRGETDRYANFFVELFSNIKDVALGDDYGKGDIVTTIEPHVQSHLENVLSKLNEEYGSDHTGAIVMDPMSGEIVAMGVVPEFDLNAFQKEKNERIFANPLVENVYEMGSIVKPLTIAAGLDSGVITPRTEYYDHGFLELNTERINNYDGEGRGQVDMQTVLNKSLNTGVAFVMQKMGIKDFSRYMLAFGLGDVTGIDLPNETGGLVSNLSSPREIEHATASFGQGIAMTPVSITRALATLGNGGVLVTPHLVKKIEYENGTADIARYDNKPRVISEETSEEISRMLVEVVDDALLEGSVALPNHTIGAKTGTAQIANPETGGYYEDRYLHSFFGYFPAFEPRFIIFLYTVEPKGVRYASQSLTEPFMNITKFLIHYYDIPPDR